MIGDAGDELDDGWDGRGIDRVGVGSDSCGTSIAESPELEAGNTSGTGGGFEGGLAMMFCSLPRARENELNQDVRDDFCFT